MGIRTGYIASGARVRTVLAMIPGVGASLLPKLACPACWPAYAGLMTSLGLGFVLETTWLLTITTLFLAACLGALFVQARRADQWAALVMGLIAAGVILVAKFVAEIDLLIYGGVGGLVFAFYWSLRVMPDDICPATDSNERQI